MSGTARFQWRAVNRQNSIALLFTALVLGIASPAVSESSEHPLATNNRSAQATLQVELLVEPDRASISVDPTISEIVSVALLSGAAREAGGAQGRTFDASDIIPGSAKLGPTETTVVGSPTLEDVDGDGDLDLRLAFSLETASMPCGPGNAIVTAKTKLGETITARGRIVVRGCFGGGNGVIDFESLGIAPGSQIDLPDNAAQQVLGFLFTPGPNNDSKLLDSHYGNAQPGWGYNGTTVAGLHDDIVMTRVNGGTFTLLGFDLSGFPFDEEVPFTVESSDGTIAEFEVDGMVDGIDGVEDFESFEAPPAGFIDVTSVVWEHFGGGTNRGTFHLDNIHYVSDCDLVLRLETPFVFGRGRTSRDRCTCITTGTPSSPSPSSSGSRMRAGMCAHEKPSLHVRFLSATSTREVSNFRFLGTRRTATVSSSWV